VPVKNVDTVCKEPLHFSFVGQTLAAEDVDGTEVGSLHATEPHVCYVLNKKLLHLKPRVHIAEICVNDDLQEHPGIVGLKYYLCHCLIEITFLLIATTR